MAVLGTDGHAPQYSHSRPWSIWHIDNIYKGEHGLNKIVPNVDDYVVSPSTETTYRVIDLDTVSYFPTLKEINNNGPLNDKSRLLPRETSDSYRCYIDKSITPYALSVDAGLHASGELLTTGVIFRGDISNNDIVSEVRDNSGTVVSNNVELENIIDNVNSFKFMPSCTTTAELQEGETVTVVFYNNNGHIAYMRILAISETGYIADAHHSGKTIVSIEIDSPFLAKNQPNLIRRPISVSPDDLFLECIINYADGTSVNRGVDSGRVQFHGLNELLVSKIGKNTSLMLSYTLSEDESAVGAVHGAEGNFLTKTYQVETYNPSGAYLFKLYAYPKYNVALERYSLDVYLLNADRNIFINVTDKVVLEDPSSFMGNAYGDWQTGRLTLRINEVNPTYQDYTHIDDFKIKLLGPPDANPYPFEVENANRTPIVTYGIDTVASIVSSDARTIRLTSSVGETLEQFLARTYVRSQPLLDPDGSSVLPVVTHLRVITPTDSVLVPVLDFDKDIVLNDSIAEYDNLVIEFVQDSGEYELSLSVILMSAYLAENVEIVIPDPLPLITVSGSGPHVLEVHDIELTPKLAIPDDPICDDIDIEDAVLDNMQGEYNSITELLTDIMAIIQDTGKVVGTLTYEDGDGTQDFNVEEFPYPEVEVIILDDGVEICYIPVYIEDNFIIIYDEGDGSQTETWWHQTDDRFYDDMAAKLGFPGYYAMLGSNYGDPGSWQSFFLEPGYFETIELFDATPDLLGDFTAIATLEKDWRPRLPASMGISAVDENGDPIPYTYDISTEVLKEVGVHNFDIRAVNGEGVEAEPVNVTVTTVFRDPITQEGLITGESYPIQGFDPGDNGTGGPTSTLIGPDPFEILVVPPATYSVYISSDSADYFSPAEGRDAVAAAVGNGANWNTEAEIISAIEALPVQGSNITSFANITDPGIMSIALDDLQKVTKVLSFAFSDGSENNTSFDIVVSKGRQLWAALVDDRDYLDNSGDDYAPVLSKAITDGIGPNATHPGGRANDFGIEYTLSIWLTRAGLDAGIEDIAYVQVSPFTAYSGPDAIVDGQYNVRPTLTADFEIYDESDMATPIAVMPVVIFDNQYFKAAEYSGVYHNGDNVTTSGDVVDTTVPGTYLIEYNADGGKLGGPAPTETRTVIVGNNASPPSGPGGGF